MKIEICFSPALYSYYTSKKEDKIIIIVDILRASTSICTAFNNGANSIIPVATIHEAKEYKSKGYLVGAERNVKRCRFADFGNSPLEYTSEKVKDKDIVLTTTYCTKAIKKASKDQSTMIIGSFSNITAVVNYCVEKKKDVLIVCAGWNNRFNIEDTIFCGALTKKLVIKGVHAANSDSSQAVLALWRNAEPDMWSYISRSEHIKRLEANGLEDSIAYCLTEDTAAIVPVYDKETGSLIIDR